MLNGKVAVVTGASRGIGSAIAVKLAEKGAQVIINYNGSADKAEQVKLQIEAAGGVAETMQWDVSDAEACDAALAEVVKSFGRIDILVNNAGITRDGLLMRMKDEDFDKVLDINLKGTFNCVRGVSRQMMKQRYGRIINLSSVVGVSGNAGQVNYAASKAGVIGLTKSAAKELASRNITVNAIAPGFIDTDMTGALNDGQKERIMGEIPVGRFGEPEDVANLAAFLADEKAGYITGQVICVDGGMAI